MVGTDGGCQFSNAISAFSLVSSMSVVEGSMTIHALLFPLNKVIKDYNVKVKKYNIPYKLNYNFDGDSVINPSISLIGTKLVILVKIRRTLLLIALTATHAAKSCSKWCLKAHGIQ